MHIGIAGPSSWNALKPWLPVGKDLPAIFSFPLIGHLAAALRKRGHAITVFTTSTTLSTPVEIAHDNPNEEHYFTRWTRAYPYWWFRCFFGRQTVRRSPFLTAVSPYVANNLRRIAGVAARIRVIPNGVAPELFSRGQERLAVLPRTDKMTLTSVLEGFGARKNARTALRAFAKFLERHPRSRYVMFGGDYQEGGPAHVWARGQGLDAGVEFRGHTPQEILHPFLLTYKLF